MYKLKALLVTVLNYELHYQITRTINIFSTHLPRQLFYNIILQFSDVLKIF